MKNLAAINAREVKRAAEEEKREEYFSAKNIESQSKRQSYPNELSENFGKEVVHWGGRAEKERQLVELIGDQSPSAKASPRNKRGRTAREAIEENWDVGLLIGRRSEEMTQSITSQL